MNKDLFIPSLFLLDQMEKGASDIIKPSPADDDGKVDNAVKLKTDVAVEAAVTAFLNSPRKSGCE
jgi:hypothetical protein